MEHAKGHKETTAWRTSALKADSSTSSPSWMSIARRVFPSRLELKRRAGSFSDAPLAKVSFTTFFYDSPVQMMPSCDQIGVPIHFHSSTTSGSASLMSLRILLRVSPRQSPSSAILFEMSSDADWPWLAPDFFMFSSWEFERSIPLTATGGRERQAPCLTAVAVQLRDLDQIAAGVVHHGDGRARHLRRRHREFSTSGLHPL